MIRTDEYSHEWKRSEESYSQAQADHLMVGILREKYRESAIAEIESIINHGQWSAFFDGDEYAIRQSAYLGSVTALVPSGKYYTFWSTNFDRADMLHDTAYMAELSQHAESRGYYVTNHDGDPTDLLLEKLIEFEDVSRVDQIPNEADFLTTDDAIALRRELRVTRDHWDMFTLFWCLRSEYGDILAVWGTTSNRLAALENDHAELVYPTDEIEPELPWLDTYQHDDSAYDEYNTHVVVNWLWGSSEGAYRAIIGHVERILRGKERFEVCHDDIDKIAAYIEFQSRQWVQADPRGGFASDLDGRPDLALNTVDWFELALSEAREFQFDDWL